jgi:hypothetical protein
MIQTASGRGVVGAGPPWRLCSGGADDHSSMAQGRFPGALSESTIFEIVQQVLAFGLSWL